MRRVRTTGREKAPVHCDGGLPRSKFKSWTKKKKKKSPEIKKRKREKQPSNSIRKSAILERSEKLTDSASDSARKLKVYKTAIISRLIEERWKNGFHTRVYTNFNTYNRRNCRGFYRYCNF